MFGFLGKRRTEDKELEERLEALRTSLLKDGRPSPEAARAITYCEYQIRTYEDWYQWNEGKWLLWQKVIIIGGVIATLSGVMSIPTQWIDWIHDYESLGWLRGVPAAIVTVAAGFMGSFTYREDAVRHELTSNALWNELAKFQGYAAPYDNETEKEDISAFLNTVCRIVENELHSWSALVAGNRTDGNRPEPKSSSVPSDQARTVD
jgi:hypothetical protein